MQYLLQRRACDLILHVQKEQEITAFIKVIQ